MVALEAMAAELQRDMDARRSRQLFVDAQGPATVPEAYAQQRALRAFREGRGEGVVGFKIGYTSAAVRKGGFATMGIDHSVHGYLWDTEQKPTGVTVDHRRFGIEGELAVTLLSAAGDDVSQWEVEYEPVIEIHMMGMDGAPDGQAGLQLIGTNCIHAGVVHSDAGRRCLLGEVPLACLMVVRVGGKEIEQV